MGRIGKEEGALYPLHSRAISLYRKLKVIEYQFLKDCCEYLYTRNLKGRSLII